MKTKPEWFVGSWETESRVVLKIIKTARSFRVQAFDKDDGEEFIVSRTAWDGKVLQFETFVPSTRYRTRNRLVLDSKTKLTQELTIWETWVKIADVENG